MKKLLTVFTLLLCAISMSAASVKIDAAHFPDAAFRGEVLGIDKMGNNNGYLDDAEASKVESAGHWTTETSIRINSATKAYDGSSNKIQDFTGIKYFTNLKQFGVNNEIQFAPSASYTIDLSGLTKLETVYMNNTGNPYSIHLNLKNCTALKYLNITREQAPITFDITGCKNLESITKTMCVHASSSDSFYLSASASDFPKLTSVRLYNNYYLKNINISAPGLKSLEISSCQALIGNENLSIGGCTGLETLKVYNNSKLSNITFNIANFTKLKTLYLSGNNLNNNTFDISKHSVLLSDGDSYFGNQNNSYSVNVKMTAAQKANFLASDSKNARVNVTVVSGGTTTDTTKPTLPTDHSIKYSVTSNSIAINWTAATDNVTEKDKLSYRADIKEYGTTTWTQKTLGYATSYTFTGLKPSTKYVVDVYVKDEAGNSIYYGETTITTSAAADVTKPTLPTDHILKYSVTSSSITINWTAATDNVTAKDKLIYRADIKEYGTTTWTQKTLGYATSYTFTGLKASTKYVVDVYVKDEAGNGIYYGEVTVTTSAAADVTKPTLPSDHSFKYSVTSSSISINWTAATDNVTAKDKLSYRADIKVNGGSTWTTNTLGYATSYTFTGLKANTQYVVDVFVKDEAGNGIYYGETTITTADTGTNYPLKIAGTQVTSANASDILGNGGKVKYDNATHTLTLNNATINSTTEKAIETTGSLIIKLVGTNTINSTSATAIYGPSSEGFTMEIEGSGLTSSSLNVTSGSGIAIYSNKARLSFSNSTITAKGATYGVYSSNSITIGVTAKLSATGTGSGSVVSPDGIYYSGLSITKPAGAKIGTVSSNKAVVDASGKLVKTEVVFETVKYDLEIAGKQVTSINKDNIPVNFGKATFDPTTNTLTLNTVTLSVANDQAIYSSIPLTINLIGTSTLSSTGNYTIECDQDLTIQSASGTGRLEISTNSYCIGTRRSTVIKNCSISATTTGSNMKGFYGYSTADLTIEDATVDVKTPSTGKAISDFKTLTLNNVGIATPLNGSYSSTNKCVVTAANVAATEVSIKPYETYNVSILGNPITSLNCTDVVGDGTVVYTPATKTLTLNNANLSSDAYDETIFAKDQDLTIVLKGSNTITHTRYSAIKLNSSSTHYTLTIKSLDGTGTLNTGGGAVGIYTPNHNLIIDNCTVNIPSAKNVGISGENSGGKLTINNANVTVKATTAAIKGFADISLTNSFIQAPSGAQVSSGAIVCDGSICKEVTIKKGVDPTTIAPTVANKTITVVGTTSSSIKLSWNAASDNTTAANALMYTVVYSKKGSSMDNLWKVVGQTTTEITGLEEDTEYAISMWVEDADKNSTNYTPTTAKTAKYVDTVNPTISGSDEITVVKVDFDAIKLSWNEASDNTTATDKIVYEISYSHDGTTATEYVTGTTEVTLSGLSDETEYEISIKAYDEAGNFVAYKTVKVTTPQGPDFEAPILPSDISVSLIDVTPTTAKISWNPATDKRSTTLYYEVYYTIDGSSWIVDDGNSDCTYEFTGLTPNTTYTVQVSVGDEAKNYSNYAELTFTTPAIPNSIEAIIAKNPDAKMYDIDGKRVDKSYSGIVIINGKKYVVKK